MNQSNFYKDSDIYKLTAKMVAFLVLAIALCHVSRGYIMPVFTLVGVCMALTSKLGWVTGLRSMPSTPCERRNSKLSTRRQVCQL